MPLVPTDGGNVVFRWNCFGMHSLPISLAAKLQLWILGCWPRRSLWTYAPLIKFRKAQTLGERRWSKMATHEVDRRRHLKATSRTFHAYRWMFTNCRVFIKPSLIFVPFSVIFNIPLGLPLCPLHCVILCYSGANSIDHHIITAHLVWHIGSWFWTVLVLHPDSVALFHKLTDMEVSVVLKKRSCKLDVKGISVSGKVNVKSAKNWNSWEHRDHMPLTSTNVKTCPSRFMTLIAAQCELENKRM